MIHMFFLVLHSFGRLTMYKSTANSFTSKHLLSLYLYLISDLTFLRKREKGDMRPANFHNIPISHSIIDKNSIFVASNHFKNIYCKLPLYRFVFRTKFLCVIKIPLTFCKSKYLTLEIFKIITRDSF